MTLRGPGMPPKELHRGWRQTAVTVVATLVVGGVVLLFSPGSADPEIRRAAPEASETSPKGQTSPCPRSDRLAEDRSPEAVRPSDAEALEIPVEVPSTITASDAAKSPCAGFEMESGELRLIPSLL